MKPAPDLPPVDGPPPNGGRRARLPCLLLPDTPPAGPVEPSPSDPAPAQHYWKTVAASVRGAAHISGGQPCQDAHAWIAEGGWLTAVVCDGAGSAAWAEIGARHACVSLAHALGLGNPDWRSGGADGAPDWEAFESHLRHAIEAARASLPLGERAALCDFHATVVGCVVGPAGGRFFHIGDGAAIALRGQDLHTLAHSPPANGESAELTYFYTLDDWPEQLRITPVPPGVDLLLLMSDGAATFTLASQPGVVEPRFVRPVSQHLAQPGLDVVTGAADLEATLDRPEADRVTRDDKTLLWAQRLPVDTP